MQARPEEPVRELSGDVSRSRRRQTKAAHAVRQLMQSATRRCPQRRAAHPAWLRILPAGSHLVSCWLEAALLLAAGLPALGSQSFGPYSARRTCALTPAAIPVPQYCVRNGTYSAALPDDLGSQPGSPCTKMQGLTCVRCAPGGACAHWTHGPPTQTVGEAAASQAEAQRRSRLTTPRSAELCAVQAGNFVPDQPSRHPRALCSSVELAKQSSLPWTSRSWRCSTPCRPLQSQCCRQVGPPDKLSTTFAMPAWGVCLALASILGG